MVTALNRRERGVALLTVLLGIALMTLIIVDFAMSAGLGFVSAANQANELRAYYLARSGLNVGLALLAQDERADVQSQNPVDTLDDVWALPYPPMTLQGGTVALSIVDETRKLAINSLVDPGSGAPNQDALARMDRLFTILDINTNLLGSIVEWITPANGSLSPTGADYYMGLRPPYQPRNGPMPTIGDLQMVKGVDEAVFNRLRQFLTVMPENQVNANTASPQVLASLEPELMANQKIVEEIVAERAIRPFSKVTDLINDIAGVGPFSSRLTQVLTTRSQFFTIVGMGTYAGARKMVAGTFHRETSGIGTLATWHED